MNSILPGCIVPLHSVLNQDQKVIFEDLK